MTRTPGRRHTAAGLLAILGAVALLVACTTPPPATPASPASPAPGPTVAPKAPGQASTPAPKAATIPSGQVVFGNAAIGSNNPIYNPGNGGGSSQGAQLYWPVFDGLTWVGRDGKLNAGLARAWATQDAKTWTFTLRDDVRFHDGTDLVADDVVGTFDWYRNPANGAQSIAMFGNVESIRAQDPRTVVFELRTPAAAFPKTIALGFVMKGRQIRAEGMEAVLRQPQGTGPYRFERLLPRQELRFEAMPASFVTPRPQAAIQTLLIKDIAEAASRLAALRAGDSDISNLNIDQVTEAERAGLTIGTFMASAQSHFTLDVTRPPFNDRRVRQAMNHAINREAIIRNLFRGIGRVDAQLIGEGVLGYNPDLRPYAFDQARARQLMAEAGFPNGFNTTITYTALSPTQANDTVLIMAQDLAAVGVRTELRLVQSPEWLQQYFGPPEGRPGIWAGTTNWEQTFEAESVWRWWSDEVGVGTPGAQNGGRRWEDQTFFDLYRRAKQTLDETERNRRYQEAGRYLHEQAPVIFLWQPGAVVAFNGQRWAYEPGAYGDMYSANRLQVRGR